MLFCVGEIIAIRSSRFWRRAVNFRISTPRLVPLTLHALSDETSEIPIPVHFYKTGKKIFYSSNALMSVVWTGHVSFNARKNSCPVWASATGVIAMKRLISVK